MAEGPPILQVAQLDKRYGGVLAVRGVSFALEEGSITGLIGPNGSGKTTVFNLITGTDRADAGTVLLRGRRIEGLPPHRIARLGIGRTFQLVRLFPGMTALENLLVAAVEEDGNGRREQARDLLEEFGLAGLANEEAASLSFGQQKLLEFARLLMSRHGLLLLDEPFAGVNPSTANVLVERIRRLQAMGMAVFIVDHEMRLIMDVCQTVMVLNHGELIAQGPPEEIRRDPRVNAVYFGR